MFSLLKLDPHLTVYFTGQKITFFIKDFFSKCEDNKIRWEEDVLRLDPF